MSDIVSHHANGAADEAAVDEAAARRAAELSEKVAKHREAGWADRVKFNYETVGTGAVPEYDATRDECEWLGNAAVYAWDDEYGEVGPVDEKLEQELFFGENLMKAGAAIQALSFTVNVQGPEQIQPFREFKDAGLHPVILDNVTKCGYHWPTPIQAYTIPAVLSGRDVVGIAQTGSGKTAAYLIPILSRLMGKAKMLAAPRPNPRNYDPMTDKVRAEPLVLVVCPTRELACQIFDEARRLCYRTMLRPCVIYGGASLRQQRENLQMGCDVLIATPGRLMDYMRDVKLLSFNRLKFTVIDEADELLTSGWEEIMEKLFQGSDMNTDADHTYLMFSATFPKAERRLAREYMEDDFVKIKVGRVGSTHANIKQNIVYVDQSAKNQALLDLITSGEPQRTLVFVNSKITCDMVDDFLYNNGLPTTSIHSDRTQREREDALRSFRTARTPIMVATGVTARGLDVANIKHVINYDLPRVEHGGITEYVHRIGRTARIGNQGVATSFYNDRDDGIAPDLVKLLLEAKQNIPDFLEQFKPENPSEPINFHDGTDEESEAEDFGGGFGGIDSGFDSGGDGVEKNTKVDDGWGATADEPFKDDVDDKVGAW